MQQIISQKTVCQSLWHNFEATDYLSWSIVYTCLYQSFIVDIIQLETPENDEDDDEDDHYDSETDYDPTSK